MQNARRYVSSTRAVSLVSLQGAQIALSFIASLLLTRHLGASDFGIYAYCLGAMTFLAVPVQTGLTSIVVREVARAETTQSWSEVRGLVRRARQFVVAYSVLIIGATSAIAHSVLGPDSPWVPTYIVAILILPFLALNGIHAATLNGLNRTLTGQFLESVLRPLLFVVAVTGVLLAPSGALTPFSAMTGHLASYVLVVVLSYYVTRAFLPDAALTGPPTFADSAWGKSFGMFVSLAAAQMLTQHADFLVLGALASSDSIGIYRVASQTALLVGLPLAAINLALAPMFSRLFAQQQISDLQSAVATGGRTVLAYSVAPALVLVLFGEQLLGFAFGDEFSAGATALAILVAGQMVTCIAGPVGLLMNMTGHERYTLLAFAASAVVNVLATVALVPAFGIEGAATANLLGMLTWNAVLVYLARQRIGISTVPFARQAATATRMPNFFIVGAPKCGTTSLSEWLREHPSVFIPKLKEPQYFNTDHEYVFPRLSASAYRGLFRRATQRHFAVGECSTWYLHSEVAVTRILQMDASARFIVCLRNPVEMVQSLHQQLTADLEEPILDFPTAWQSHFSRPRQQAPTHPFLDYGRACKLGSAVSTLFRRVGRSQVLIVLMDDLRRDPRTEYQRVLAFLGVSDDGRHEFPLANASATNRFPSFARLLRWTGQMKARSTLPAFRLGILDFLRKMNTVPAPRAKLAPALLQELRVFFRDDVALLSQELGKDLSHWVRPDDSVGT
jgi:O-antigen/teichoic acid export membrane protein